MSDPIGESLPYHTDAEPTGEQPAWEAVVKILIPHTDRNGTPVASHAAAEDYMSETLRGQFLDWAYVSLVEQVKVSDPYIEGSFGA